MNDMSSGSIPRHLLRMTAFILAGLLMQILYSLADIYWVGRLGEDAVAAVAVSSNLMFLVMALSQGIAVGTVALVSQAAGRKEPATVQRLFNQSQCLSVLAGLLVLVVAYAFKRIYAHGLAGDGNAARLTVEFLDPFIPAMALQFCVVGLASALRGLGDMKPGLIAQLLSVLLNMVLAPILIFGWIGASSMGVRGAAMATLISTAAAVLGLALYLSRQNTYLRVNFSQWRPDWQLWGRILGIGLPAGAEFLLMAIIMGLVYAVLRPFGSEAQAGYGIGMRIMQAGFMPSVALSFAVAAVVGQNFGAGRHLRVRETFKAGRRLTVGCMLTFTMLCQFASEPMMRCFSEDAAVVAVGATYLRVVSVAYVASGLAMLSAGVFQGLGNTLPSMLASGSRLLVFVLSVVLLARRPGFTMLQVWTASIVSIGVQSVMSLLLLRVELRRKLRADVPMPTTVATPSSV